MPEACTWPLSRALHRLAADVVGRHVVADRGAVARVERLEEGDRGPQVRRALGPYVESRVSLRAHAPRDRILVAGGDALREADAEQARVTLAQRQAIDVVAEVAHVDRHLAAREEAGGAAQQRDRRLHLGQHRRARLARRGEELVALAVEREAREQPHDTRGDRDAAGECEERGAVAASGRGKHGEIAR
jgi:hypothetical protein